MIENGAAYTSYKMHQGQRLDERVVTVDRERGKVSCDCKWWGTMRLLCRHSLTVMHSLGTFGCVPFQDFPKEYIKDRWTREARDAFDDLIIQRPFLSVDFFSCSAGSTFLSPDFFSSPAGIVFSLVPSSPAMKAFLSSVQIAPQQVP
ncbi:hypothetical protein LINPERPRIM_LOCUS15086 [Linum perenne]